MPSFGPLRGRTVVELGGVGPAPFCGMLLADLGARVVQIARPDPPAGLPDGQLRFGVVNRSRESIVIDLSRPEGVAAVLRIVDSADAVIEGFRPGVAERIGVGPEICLARNPGLVYGRITGWGHHGPWSNRAGHEPNYVGLAGGLAPVSRAGETAAPPGGQHGHVGAAAMSLALGVVSALLEARDSGVGQVVEASVVDAVATRLAITIGMAAANRAGAVTAGAVAAGTVAADRAGEPAPGDGATAEDSTTAEDSVNVAVGTSAAVGTNAPYAESYRCADGRFVAVGAIEDVFFARLLATLGLTGHPAFGGDRFDRRVWPRMRTVLAEVFLTRTRDEWDEIFATVDACVSPVLTVEEAMVHEHNRRRGVYVDVGGFVQPAPAPRFSRTGLAVPSPAVPAGTHSVAVLRAAGFSVAEVAALVTAGVVVSRSAT